MSFGANPFGSLFGSTDATPPSISGVSPAADSEIYTSDSIEFTVSDDNAIGTVVVLAEYTVEPYYEVIYDGTDFSGAFDYASSVDADSTSAAFTITRDDGWLGDVSIVVIAHDAAGNMLREVIGYTLNGYPYTPSITNVVPAASEITRTTAISFSITDPRGTVASTHVSVYCVTDDVDELAWDGSAWTSKYSGSSRAAIEGGYRYTIRRRGGWPLPPAGQATAFKLRISVTDSDGNTEVLL